MTMVVLGIVRVIPRAVGLRFMRALGLVLYYLMRDRRAVALTNLDIAFGSTLTSSEKAAIAKKSFQNFLALVFDFLKLPQMPQALQAQFIEIHGEEHLKEALSVGRGVLAVSAHFGNFLLLLSIMGLKGYPLHVVTRHFKSDRTEGLYNGVLARFKVWTFPRRHEAANILKALKNGTIVAYVLDQNMRAENGVFVEFFGKPASTIKGLGTLAGRYGSPILPVFIVSTPDGRHSIHIAEAFIPDNTRDMKARDLELTQHFTHAIEAWIRRYPEQWFWIHQRWKTRPAGEPAIYPPRGGLRKLFKQWRRRRRALQDEGRQKIS